MSRVLLTGGAGFLGSHMAEYLLARGYTVTAIDNCATGRQTNLTDSEEYDAFEYRFCDVRHDELPTDIDSIFHLASIADPEAYQERPVETSEVNGIATHRLLEHAVDESASFLFTSTSEVYGDPKRHPQTEDYTGNVDPYGPRACYDESKRFGETLVRSYADQYDLNTSIARIFNTYGPRLKDGRVIPTFIQQALAGEPLTVHGDGEQTRSFCYVDDLIDGLYRLHQSEISTPTNLGNPDERTIQETAETILDVIGSGSDIVYTERPPDDPEIRRPAIGKAEEQLNWSPTTPFEEGIRRTTEWFRDETTK